MNIPVIEVMALIDGRPSPFKVLTGTVAGWGPLADPETGEPACGTIVLAGGQYMHIVQSTEDFERALMESIARHQRQRALAAGPPIVGAR